MSFLLNLDMCAASVRQVARVTGRLAQHLGNLHVSAVTITGLDLWLLRPATPFRYLQCYGGVLRQVRVVSVDDDVAHQAARVGHSLRSPGARMATIDLLVAATALVHGLTLVTHSTQLYAPIPGLTVVDWTLP